MSQHYTSRIAAIQAEWACSNAEGGTVQDTVHRGRVIFCLFQLIKLLSNVVSCTLLHDHGHAQSSIVVLAVDVI